MVPEVFFHSFKSSELQDQHCKKYAFWISIFEVYCKTFVQILGREIDSNLCEENEWYFYPWNQMVVLYYTLVLHKHTHTHNTVKWGRDCSTSNQVFCINSEYLEIHGFGSTKCLRANRYIGAGHFGKRWKGSADVDANLPLRDILNQTDNRTTCQNKALIISVLVLCSSTCGPQLSYDAAYYPGILLVRLAIAFQLLYFHTKKRRKKFVQL